jgi:hypothetical protein
MTLLLLATATLTTDGHVAHGGLALLVGGSVLRDALGRTGDCAALGVRGV